MDPKTLKYTASHEWVKRDGDIATVGVSRFAVDQLTDLILIDLTKSKVGSTLEAGSSFGEIESVKAVSDLYAPVSGEVVEVNPAVAENVQLLAEDPYEKGWLVKLRLTDPAQVDALLSFDDYQKQVMDSPH
ncbi:MAG: glycine cleavage system protein GcvH [Isosphaeraceae bacterium]